MIITAAEGETTTHVWIKGNKMRMEMDVEGTTMVVIVDGDAQTYIMYTLPDKMGFFMQYQEEDSVINESESIMGYHPIVVGTETIDGKVCTVIEYDYSDADMGIVSAKAWIWNEYGFPIQVVVTDSQGHITTMLYKNIEIGGNIDDSMFIAPADVMILPMGGM
jgi:outer membrane lipoprotein-sorting protein